MQWAAQPPTCGASARNREQALSDFFPVYKQPRRGHFARSNAAYANRIALGAPGGIRC
jgi:hypothetical protein